MTIDFRKIRVVQNLGDEPVEADMRELVGNTLYHAAYDIWQDELARRIYSAKAPAELDERERVFAHSVMEAAQLPIFIKRPILEELGTERIENAE